MSKPIDEGEGTPGPEPAVEDSGAGERLWIQDRAQRAVEEWSARDKVVALPIASPATKRGEKKKKKKKDKKAGKKSKSRAPLSRDSVTGVDEALEAIKQLESSPLGRIWLSDGLSSSVSPAADQPGVIAALPRRKVKAGAAMSKSGAVPSMARDNKFTASTWDAVARMFIWLWAGIRYLWGNTKDSLRGRDNRRNRAKRLRTIMESLGPTFVKLGQQIAIRADMIPYEYCEELSKMLDRVAPFPSDHALQAIERVTGKPVTDTFAVFDPTPIGSASLACVYQALLKDGQKVAVKVRRPGIGEMLAADLKAMGWMMRFSEFLSLSRPGLTKNVRYELHSMLMEELDFFREARYTEIFGRRAHSKGQRYITAPQVYFELSGADVLVTEFVSGVFLAELLHALDTDDQETLASMRERGIDPKLVARRLVMAFNWETMESLLFHADPHPANIVVRPDNTLVFIDFGSCGRFSTKHKRLWRQFYMYLTQEDVYGMVETSISILEPLPPIDVESFTKEVEVLYWDWMYAMKSKHSEWWEKATGVMWMKLVEISRRYDVPLNLDTLRSFRATFLYDTIMFRLWKDLKMEKEYRRYNKAAGMRSEKRVKRALKRRLFNGLDKGDYVVVEESLKMGQQMMGRVQKFLDTPSPHFGAIVDKAAYAVSITLQTALFFLAMNVVGIILLDLYYLFTGETVRIWDLAVRIINHPFYQIIPLAIIFVVVRKVIMRTRDVDV